MPPTVSIVVVTRGAEPASIERALRSIEGQLDSSEVLVAGDDPGSPHLARVVAPPPDAPPADVRNAALEVASGRYVVVLDPNERLAPGALARHVAALDAAPRAAASYGRTAVHDEEGGAGRTRLLPEHGRGGDVLTALIKDKQLVPSSAAIVWRRDDERPLRYDELTTPAALRVGLLVRAARAGAELLFQPAIVAERDAERIDLVAQEELVKVFLGVLYAAEPIEERLEQHARLRLARHLVAIGKHHYRHGDHRRAGKFFDEAVRAAPGYFKGRRYQFLNFVKNVMSR